MSLALKFSGSLKSGGAFNVCDCSPSGLCRLIPGTTVYSWLFTSYGNLEFPRIFSAELTNGNWCIVFQCKSDSIKYNPILIY